jgi:hypothetical protein
VRQPDAGGSAVQLCVDLADTVSFKAGLKLGLRRVLSRAGPRRLRPEKGDGLHQGRALGAAP